MQDFLTDRTIEKINENAIANILVDLDFLEEQFRGAGRANLSSLFSELRSVRPSPSTFPPHIYLFCSLPLLVNAPFVDDIYRDVRFGRRIPHTLTTPNDIRKRQAEKAHRAT